MLRCIIIDDERPSIRIIKRYIERIPTLQLLGETTNPLTGIEMVKTQNPDLVFLDIEMDEMSGIDVMKIIGKETLVIFCTAYSEFAVTSYDLQAVDYLLKPIEFDRFLRGVQRATNIIKAQPTVYEDAIPNDYIFVKAGQKGKMLKIDIDDIEIVEAKNNYVAFYCEGKKTLAYLTMKELEERLPRSQFMRVHKSYIIALKQISRMENNELVLKRDGIRVPIGSSYKEAFLARMRKKLMS